MTELLYRVHPAADVSLRAAGDGRTICGIAVPYGEPANIESPVEGRFVETFRPGAFKKTIRQRGDKIGLNLLHDRRTRLPIGRAVVLREETLGLYGEFRVSATAAGDEALELVRDGVPVGLSIGFVPIQDKWSSDRTAVERIEARLEEVSVVNQPAYAGAMVTGLRALAPAARFTAAEAQRRLHHALKGPHQ